MAARNNDPVVTYMLVSQPGIDIEIKDICLINIYEIKSKLFFLSHFKSKKIFIKFENNAFIKKPLIMPKRVIIQKLLIF